MKICFLISHPIQYFSPVFRKITQFSGVNLSIIYHTKVGSSSYYDVGFDKTVQWDTPLLDGYSFTFLSTKERVGGLQSKVIAEIIRQSPHIVILHGYNHMTNLIGWFIAKVIGAKVLMRGDTRPFYHHKKASLKPYIKRFLFRYVDGCLTIGSLNKKYYKSLGVPEDKIHFVPFCVDNEFFDLGSVKVQVRRGLRMELGIEAKAKVVLFVAKLISRKRPADLIAAVALLKKSHPDVVLVLAGSGNDENSLRLQASNSLVDVRFLGFRNQSELPSIYAMSDVFVLPAEAEPWGLVVNEAMAAGLPVVVSDDVGAAPDLVEGKETGVVYPVGNISRLADALDSLLSSPEDMSRFGNNARRVIEKWSVTACASGIIDVARKVLNPGQQ